MLIPLLVVSLSLGDGAPAVLEDAKNGYAFTVPEGYREVPEPATQHLLMRGTPGQSSYGVVSLIGLTGALPRGELNRELVEQAAKASAAQNGVTMTRFEYRTVVWGELTLDLVLSWASKNGMEMLTLATQMPLRPRAVQVQTIGNATDEARLVAEHTAVVASFRGESTWLGDAQRSEQLGRIIGLVVGGSGALALLLWLRRRSKPRPG